MKIKVIQRETRAEYGEKIKQVRDRITKLIIHVPSFLKKVMTEFKAYHFEKFDRKLKHDFDALVTEEKFNEATKICEQMKPKFSTIRYSFESKYENEELNTLIDEFYNLANIYFESYKNLIHKFIHDNPYSTFFNYGEVFNDSYSVVVFTLTLYDYKKSEFGTLLGKNMNHFIGWLLKEKNKNKEIFIDDLPPNIFKYTSQINDLEAIIDGILKTEFDENSDEYQIGKMMVIDDISTKHIGQMLNKDTKYVAMTKKTIIKRLTSNPKILQIVNEIKENA